MVTRLYFNIPSCILKSKSTQVLIELFFSGNPSVIFAFCTLFGIELISGTIKLSSARSTSDLAIFSVEKECNNDPITLTCPVDWEQEIN